jgi:hypothetical protein
VRALLVALVSVTPLVLALLACRPPRQSGEYRVLTGDEPDATSAVELPADPWQLNRGCDAPRGSRRSAKSAEGSTIASATCRVDLVLTETHVRSLCVAVSDGRVDFLSAVQGADENPNIGFRRYNQPVIVGPSCDPANCAGAMQPGPEARVGAWFSVDLVLASRRPIGMVEPPRAVPPFPEFHGRVRFTADSIEVEMPDGGRVAGVRAPAG